MEPQLFAIVDTNDPDAIYCLGIDTGEEAVTFRQDPLSGSKSFRVSRSMYSALAVVNRMTKGYARFDLVTYKTEEDDKVPYEEGVCPACNNERKVPVDLSDVFPPDIASSLEDTIPCPECTDEYGNVGSSAN